MSLTRDNLKAAAIGILNVHIALRAKTDWHLIEHIDGNDFVKLPKPKSDADVRLRQCLDFKKDIEAAKTPDDFIEICKKLYNEREVLNNNDRYTATRFIFGTLPGLVGLPIVNPKLLMPVTLDTIRNMILKVYAQDPAMRALEDQISLNLRKEESALNQEKNSKLTDGRTKKKAELEQQLLPFVADPNDESIKGLFDGFIKKDKTIALEKEESWDVFLANILTGVRKTELMDAVCEAVDNVAEGVTTKVKINWAAKGEVEKKDEAEKKADAGNTKGIVAALQTPAPVVGSAPESTEVKKAKDFPPLPSVPVAPPRVSSKAPTATASEEERESRAKARAEREELQRLAKELQDKEAKEKAERLAREKAAKEREAAKEKAAKEAKEREAKEAREEERRSRRQTKPSSRLDDYEQSYYRAGSGPKR